MEKESSLPVELQPFTKIDAYTTFSVEYTMKGDDDVHFHFFNTDETNALMQQKGDDQYWKLIFPKCLDAIARDHFGFEYPRLQASLIRGVLRYEQDEKAIGEDSWWMIAQKIKVPDPDILVFKFLEKLDQALETEMRK